jgi:hypothetical protein
MPKQQIPEDSKIHCTLNPTACEYDTSLAACYPQMHAALLQHPGLLLVAITELQPPCEVTDRRLETAGVYLWYSMLLQCKIQWKDTAAGCDVTVMYVLPQIALQGATPGCLGVVSYSCHQCAHAIWCASSCSNQGRDANGRNCSDRHLVCYCSGQLHQHCVEGSVITTIAAASGCRNVAADSSRRQNTGHARLMPSLCDCSCRAFMTAHELNELSLRVHL